MFLQVDKAILEALASSQENMDEDRAFAMSLVPTLQRYQGRDKRRLQMAILQAVDNFEDAACQSQQSEQYYHMPQDYTL